MRFETPGALWGLLSLVLLAIFSLWRQAAARAVVPSLRLWRMIPERNPPVRALRRPRWRFELLLQALALAAAVTALAGPFLETAEPAPRKVALVFDTSSRMLAGSRLERAREEARRLISRLRPSDEIVVYAAVPDPRRVLRLDEVRAVHEHVDLAPLLAAAREETPHVVCFSDRAPPGPVAASALFGGEGGNVGIVEFTVDDQEVFARIANHGPSRRVPLKLEWTGKTLALDLDLPPGQTAWSRRPEDLGGAGAVTLSLETRDHFPLDDAVTATRLAPPRAVVSLSGRHVGFLVRALESIPGIVVLRGAAESLVAIGVDAPPEGRAKLRVWVQSPPVPVPATAVTIRDHRLTAGLREADVRRSLVGAIGLDPQAQALVLANGKPVVTLAGDALRLSIETTSGWPLTPSFPIFWANVIDFAGGPAGAFAVVRTGRPYGLPAGAATVVARDASAVWSVSKGGSFLAHTVGEYEVSDAPGKPRLVANLLDARESDTRGERRPLEWSPADASGGATVRRPLAGHLAALVLLLVAAAWFLERRKA